MALPAGPGVIVAGPVDMIGVSKGIIPTSLARHRGRYGVCRAAWAAFPAVIGDGRGHFPLKATRLLPQDADFAAFLAASAAFLAAAMPSFTSCRARPKAMASAGTSAVITEPAAVKAPSPIRTGATITVLEPTNTSAPMVVLCLKKPS